MKDFFKSPVEVRDTVICMVKNYRSLQEAVVVDITDKTILVETNVIQPSDYSKYRLKQDQFIVIEQGRKC
jgi:hypothetical protein